MLLKSALKYSKYKKSENYQEEFNRICLLFFNNFSIERSLMLLEMEFQVFALDYLIDCCVLFVL